MSKNRPNVSDPGRVIAHRGASQVAPENTLSAFREAARQGAFWVEFDVSLLGDDTPVVHHDATLERCTSGAGPLTAIAQGDLSSIQAGVAHGARFPEEPLPTLEMALDLIEELGFWANLEMKPHTSEAGVLSSVVAEALSGRSWTRSRVITSSFILSELQAFRAKMPDAPVAVLWDEPPEYWRAEVDALNAAAMHLSYKHIRQSLVIDATAQGIDTRVFTINEPPLMERFRDHGLTGVITDHPPLFLEDPNWRDWAAS